MKTKVLLLIMAILMIVACGGWSESNTESISVVKQNDEAKEDPTAANPSKDLGKMPTDVNFYKRMLIGFCKANYKNKFGKEFKEKGFYLNKKPKFVNDTTVTTGGLHNNNADFKATIKRIAKDTYKITFEIKMEIENDFSNWKRWDDTTDTIRFKE